MCRVNKRRESLWKQKKGIDFRSFIEKEFINIGMSGDKKYYIKIADNQQFLLRVADADILASFSNILMLLSNTLRRIILI